MLNTGSVFEITTVVVYFFTWLKNFTCIKESLAAIIFQIILTFPTIVESNAIYAVPTIAHFSHFRKCFYNSLISL